MRHRAIEAGINLSNRTLGMLRPGRPRVFAYTDSRGLNFQSRLGKSGSGSWTSRLRTSFTVTQRVCPERHTTLLDFLDALDQQRGSTAYDAVVVHCGVVDFSPRPVSNIARIRGDKAGSAAFDELFAANEEHHRTPSAVEYAGEPTTTLYSTAFLEEILLPRLSAVPSLVWISSNDFVPGWEGNYTKGRPANIQETVSGFDRLMVERLEHVVNLHEWTHDEVRRYTFDNVHLTPAGFDDVARRTAAALRGALAGTTAQLA